MQNDSRFLVRTKLKVEVKSLMPVEKEQFTDFCDSSWTPNWHALYTRHQHEKGVAQALSNKGFEVFLPQYATIRQWKDRRKEISLPLFPCYVFIQDRLDRTLEIMTTPGVYSLVGCAGRAAVIPQDEIDAVRRLVESPLRIEPHPFLKNGDMVRVKSGPLEGIEGALVRMKSAFRLVLSVEMLQKSVSVEVDMASVEQVTRGGSIGVYADLTRGVGMVPLAQAYAL